MQTTKKPRRSHKTRSMSIQIKIMIPAMVLIIFICAAMAVMFRSRLSSDMVISGGELADYVGNLTVNKMNGSLVERLKTRGEGTAVYTALESTLNSTMEKSAIIAMQILYTDGEKVYYGMDRSGQPVASGTVFSDYEKLHLAFEGYSIRRTGIDHTKDGAVISAYRPIYDRTMGLVGVLGCDYDASGVEKALRTTIISVVVFGILCIIIAILVFYIITKRVTDNLWLVDDKINDIVSSEGDLTKTISIKTGDEVESIAEHVNQLLFYIRDIMFNIFENSKALNNSSENVATHLKDTQDSVTEVSATMEEMSAAMQDTSNSISTVSDSVNEAYSFIREVNDRVQDGGRLTSKIQESAESIQAEALRNQEAAKQRIAQISQNVNEKILLSKSAEKITGLTEDIINIADQTPFVSERQHRSGKGRGSRKGLCSRSRRDRKPGDRFCFCSRTDHGGQLRSIKSSQCAC